MHNLQPADKNPEPAHMPLLDFGLPKEKIIRGAEFRDRILWLVYLRWLAVTGLILGLTLGQILLHIPLLRLEFIILTVTLAIYNALSHLQVKRLKIEDEKSDRLLNTIANFQIALDLFLLALFLYFSGGIQNPFVTYFVFHMIIAAIMLTAKAAYLQAVWASVLIGSEIGLKYLNVLPHHQLENFLPISLYENPLYVWTFYFVLVSMLFGSVYMTYSISRELRVREERLLAANRLLEEKDRLKSQYVMMISHDLQQPLVAIQSNLKVILDGFAGPVSSEIRDLLQRLERRASQLIALIRDLLNLSRIKSYREIPKEVFSLKPMVANVVSQLEAAAVAKKLNLRLSLPEEEILINGNRDALRQVFLNLIDNAIKYTQEGGQIAVQLTLSNGKLKGVVEDTGIGIAKKDMDSIFEEFFRGNNAIRLEKDGTGLGLSVVRLALQAHGGDIKVTSPAFITQDGKGVGTRITFHIPLNIPAGG